ncbi:MAG: response regulator [Candidatus Omnitrophica bacterium]|nr:response regulator [Candidatus Omnitrophota bacterium]
MTEGPIRVLLVDDEPDFLESISFWLASKGYAVQKTSNGEAAIELIKTNPPHVVFLDCMMPTIDGFETLRRIRAVNKTLPVIMVTAGVSDENKFAGARALGMSGFFPKGGSLDQLANMLQIALRILPKVQTEPPAAPPQPGPPTRKPGALRSLIERFFPSR